LQEINWTRRKTCACPGATPHSPNVHSHFSPPFTKEKLPLYYVLLGLEKETKMTPLPLCKEKNIFFAFFAQFTYTRLHFFSFFFFSCRSHKTASLPFLNSFLLISFFFFGPTFNSKLLGFLQFSFLFSLLQKYLIPFYFSSSIFFLFFFAIPHKYRLFSQ
jgi:hypothetical protein